jgi:hypothetical protein
MAGDCSKQALLDFLREAALAGRISPAAARSWRNAAEQLFAQLTEAEAADLRRVDVPALAARAQERDSDRLRPEVIELYAGRLQTALDDFFRFLEAPDRFTSLARDTRSAQRRDAQALPPDEARALEALQLEITHYRPDILPIVLAPGRVVYLHQLPADLSAAEARRIARVVMAMAIDAVESGETGTAAQPADAAVAARNSDPATVPDGQDVAGEDNGVKGTGA